MADMVPELTPNTAIQLNKRVSLQPFAAMISLADDARADLEFCLCGRVVWWAGGWPMITVRIGSIARICRSHCAKTKAPRGAMGSSNVLGIYQKWTSERDGSTAGNQ